MLMQLSAPSSQFDNVLIGKHYRDVSRVGIWHVKSGLASTPPPEVLPHFTPISIPPAYKNSETTYWGESDGVAIASG